MKIFNDKLYELINKYELSRIGKEIISLAEEAIIISLNKKEDYSTTRTSRCAGYPDLPEDLQWPILNDVADPVEKEFIGLPKLFALQINLEEIPDIGKLPQEGMLYFFIGSNCIVFSGERDSEVIFYPKKLGKIQSLINNIDATYCLYADPEDKVHINNGYNLKFEKILTIPGIYSSLIESLQLKDSEQTKYEEFFSEYYTYIFPKERNINDDIGQMFGHLFFGWDDLRDTISRESKNNNPKDWEILVSISSNTKVEFCFSDAGYFNFFIRKNDLSKMNFENLETFVWSS